MSVETLVKDFQKALNESDKRKTTSYDTVATVRRIDGDTAWVHIPSGIDETPVKLTVDAKKGDTVQVRVGGGNAWITGNATRPPTDDTTAIYARERAYIAQGTAVEAKDTADEAQGTAVVAKETADSILIYDHDYTLETVSGHLIATFTAHLYQGGIDIHTMFDPQMFTWYLKTEDGTSYLGDGYTISIDTTTCGYGAEVIGKFTTTDDAEALATDGSNLTNSNNEPYTVRSSGESVRVRDLSTSTALYPSEKLMVVGAENEHLVTIQSLQDYLNLHLDKQVLFGTKAEWNAQAGLVSEANKLYVYTDYNTDGSGNNLAGIKVGDGDAYLIDMPFTDELYFDHIQNTSIHITDAERAFWNNKVSCYYSGGDILILTTN